MSATGATMRGRRAAEVLMVDTVRVDRITGNAVDPLTGSDVATYAEQYAGRCKVQATALQATTPEVTGHTTTVQRLAVHFPVGAFAVAVGDRVTVLSSLDPLLVGRVFRAVETAPMKTFATAYRVSVEEVAS